MPSVPELIAIYTASQANEGRNILYSALARVSDLIGFEEDILLSQDTYWSASWGNISTGSGEILAPLTVYKGQDISNNTLDGTAEPADVIALFPLDLSDLTCISTAVRKRAAVFLCPVLYILT